MPIVEVNENECVFVRDGVLCRGSIDSHVVTSHSIHANPAEEMVLPRVTLSVAVSSMASATAVERASNTWRHVAHPIQSSPQSLLPPQRISVLPQGWSVSTTQQSQLAAVSLQPTQDISAAVNDMLAEANASALAGLQDSLPLPAANSAVPETVSGLTDFRVGALGRAWLVSHFLTTSTPISIETTSWDAINLLNENVQQTLEEGADLFPYPHERFLRVMGYSRRQDFPPIEIAREHVGAIYFARNTRTLYWIADQPTTAGDDRQVYVQFVPRPLDATPASSSTVPALPAEDTRAAERTGAIQNTGVQRGRLRVMLTARDMLQNYLPDQSRLYVFADQPVAFVWRDAAYRPTNISAAYVNNHFAHNEMFNGGDRDGLRAAGENWFAYYKTMAGMRDDTATVNVLDAPVYMRFDCLYADEAWRDIAPIHPPIEEAGLLESLGFPARNIAQDSWNDPPAASLRPVGNQAQPYRRGDFVVTFCDSPFEVLACDFRLYVVRGWEMAVVFRGNAFRATNISNAYFLNFYRNGDYLTTRPSDPGTRPARYNPGAPVTPGVSDTSTVLELESQYVYIPADWLLSDVTTGWRRFQPVFSLLTNTRQAGIAMINTWGTATAPNLNTINAMAAANFNPNLAAATPPLSSGSFSGGRPPAPPAPQHTPVPISIDKPRRLMLQD